MDLRDRIIVALDVSNLKEVENLIPLLSPYVRCFKVGLQLLTSVGVPTVVKFIRDLGGKTFLDGKFCDIPNTVGEASAAASNFGVEMFNVHASAGIEAMVSAAKNKGNSKVLAVTVLTSIEENNAHLIFGSPSKAKVIQFARDAKIAGMDGIICSPQELEILGKQKELDSLLKITPGVRPKWSSTDDQKRIMTPGDAIAAGATAVVIGRPITKPPKEIGFPRDAVMLIQEEISEALGGQHG
mgnify:CR=1 FL=1